MSDAMDSLSKDAIGGRQSDLVLQHEIEQFLYSEVELLDDYRLAEWVDLLADDLHYFMPLRRNVGPRDRKREWSGPNEVAYFDDDKASMQLRLRKLQSGQSWAEEPPSRTRHLITNVRVRPASGADSFSVKSAFLCYRNRSERQTDILAGERQDILRRTRSEAGFEIVKRTILIDQTVYLPNNLSFFL